MVGRAARVAADAALWLGAIVGALCILITLLGVIFGIRPLIFRSGSMSPTITTGSLAFAHTTPVADVQVGDIVSVPVHGTRVTHRVVRVIRSGSVVRLQLRGDANRTPDQQLYQVTSVEKVWFSVPGMGFVLAWLSRPPGIFVLVLYAAGMLALIFRRPAAGRNSQGGAGGQDQPVQLQRSTDADRDDRHHRSLHVRSLLGAGLLGGTAAFGAIPSWAAFTDTVPVSGSTMTAYTVPAPTFNCGLIGVLSVQFTWTAVASATSYTLHTGTNGTTTQTIPAGTTSATLTTAISGGTAWVNANIGSGSNIWSSVNSNTRTYTVAVASICT